MSEIKAQLAYNAYAESHRASGAAAHFPFWDQLQPIQRSHWFTVIAALTREATPQIQRPTEQVVLLKFDVSNLEGLLDRCNHTGAVAEWGRRVDTQYKSILEAIMKTKADLDAGISTLTADDAAVLAAVATAGTATKTSFDDLLAAIKANPGAPVSDFEDEVDALAKSHSDFQAALSSLQAVTDSAKSADPGASTGTGTGAAGTTTLTLTATPTAPDPTTTITLSGTVTGGATTPTGSVTITDSTGAVSASATLDPSGAFTTTTGPLSAGTFSLTASYGGDAANAPSTASLGITVAAAPSGDGSDTVQTIPGGPVTQ
jgi:hypothetical protein